MTAVRQGSQRDFMGIPALNFVPEASSTPPANPKPGQEWTDTSGPVAVVKYWNGTKWVAEDGTSIPDGYITNQMVSPTAAITLSKLAVDPLARANHTGTQLAATISNFDTQVRTSRLDQMAAPTSALDVNGQRITTLAAPVNPGDAANKAYVDNARAGVSVKDPVRVVATTNLNLASPGAAIDGVTLSTGDRFLVTGQTPAAENGIYQLNGATTAATRTGDADEARDIQDGTIVAVSEGTKQGQQWIQTATVSGVPGAFTQTWIQFILGGQTYLNGNGLTLTGTTFALQVPVTVANGGTGATTLVEARANLNTVGRYAADLGALSAGSPFTITHGLNSFDVIAAFRTISDNRVIEFEWGPTTANAITVNADLAFAANTVRVVVLG